MTRKPMLSSHVSFDPERRDAQLRAAREVLAGTAEHDDTTLFRACDTLLALSSDPYDCKVAQEILAALTRDASATTHDADAPPPAGKDGGRGDGGEQS